ncbi:unnamed protein product [Globisporangium polare]
MCGVAVGALLVAAGVVLVIHGSLSLDAAQQRHNTLLYSTVPSSSSLAASLSTTTTTPAAVAAARDGDTTQSFLSSASFAFAMDAPVYTSFYLFNLTNGEQVLSGSEAPLVQQIGPYVYEKRSRKVNVQFQATPFPSAIKNTTVTTTAESSLSYGYASYQVVSSYFFSPERSNGSESDTVVAVNATYARKLQKLRARGYSERFVVAEFAQQHLTEYNRHLRDEFTANAKLRAWTQFLPWMVQQVHEEVLPAVIKRQRQRVDSASIPGNLVRMHALARTESIPRVLGDIYRDIADQFLPEILQSNLDTAKRQALPRVLDNLYQRLKVESVPYWLDKQLTSQQLRHVPMTLSSLAMKIDLIAFPYVLKEVYDRACLEAVPSILRTIKSEIVARDIANNRVQADTAQQNAVENWRKQGSTPTDFDAWFDDAPTGNPRTGFELSPTSASLQLSVEAATLILGSKVSNKRFSIVDYDTQTVATYPLDQPLATAEGFAIWKQVIAMNETAINYVLQGVNNDVALVGDYLTRVQLLFIRQYLITWAQNDIGQRDRERYWRQGYIKRTANSDINEPSVDLDIEMTGVQTGFKLQPTGASTSGVTAAIAQQLWSATSEFSFANPQGYTKWTSAMDSSPTSIQALQTGIPGLTTTQITEVGTWIQGLLLDGFIKRRAQRHWSDGTCNSVLDVPMTSCLLYDLEPSIAGSQVGFEMNPSSTLEWKVTQALRETVWDPTSSASFLVATHMSNTALGFGIWLRGIRTSQFMRVVADLKLPSMTAVQAQVIAGWLEKWAKNDLNVLNVYNWWRTSTCWDRETLTVTSPNTVTTANLQTCTESYSEVEKSSTLRTSSTQSPYFTFEKAYSIAKTVCDLDAVANTYTKRASMYDTTMKVYSCDVISTSLSNDVDEATTGFELMPSATSASDRVSLAAAFVLWNPMNVFSFENLDGYQKWFTTDSTTADGISLLQSINDAIDAACPKILGGGERSAVFNETLAAVSCGWMAKAHFDSVQAWVRAQSSARWLQNALLDQWRRGAAEELEIEPYRSAVQRGWELAVGCEASLCVLSDENGTTYQVPRDALGLWDSSNGGSFVIDAGMRLWTALSIANASSDSVAVRTAMSAIVTATQASKWETWMQRVFEWLETWVQSEYLLRDVLGHWLYAQCPTTPRFVSLVQKNPDVVTTVTTCPPVASLYTVTLSDTIVDLQQAASRPRDYFKADIVETSAKVQPKKTVQVTESWTSCEVLGPGSVKQTVASQTSLEEFQACNFLSVMANATLLIKATNTGGSGFLPLAVVPAEASFEMNLSTTTTATSVSIDIAKLMWNQSTSYAFTNLTVLQKKWYPAISQASFLEAMAADLATETQTQSASDLSPVQTYLKVWETCSITTRRVGIAWLSQSGSMIDLDANTDGVQGGFELFPSGAWKKAVAAVSGGGASGALPSFDQGLYVWRAANTFSFLNVDGTLTKDGLPTGFNAWKEIYQGVDYASEQLVPTYPAEATVQRQSTMQYVLSADQRTALLAQMIFQTTLSEPQLRGIAGWLMEWSTNVVLRDYVLTQWTVGTTPRGEKGVTFDLASQMDRLFGFTSSSSVALDLFTVASPLLAGVSAASRRDLWDVTKAGSLVNPTTQVVWCVMVATGDASRYCPSIVDDFGVITQPALDTFKAIVQASVPPQEAITKSANLTRFSLMYLQTQFDIADESSVAVIASWWQLLPDKSVFFQVNQLRTWRSSVASVSKDPLRFGFDLGFVFPVNTNVPRNASASDLVANTVDLGGGQPVNLLSACSESLEFLSSLWDSTNPVSFLHPVGIQQWQRYFRSEIDDATFRAFIDAVASSIAAIIRSSKMTSTDVMCGLQTTRNWLASWQQHPNLHQFVEFLWLQPLQATTSSSLTSPLLKGASDVLQAFPLDATTLSNGALSTAAATSQALVLWANLTLVVLDPSQSTSLLNATTGFPVWRSLLMNCFSSDPTSGACRNSSVRSKEVYQLHVSTAKVALQLLADALSSSTQLDSDSLKLMINARVVSWMLAWLDHPLFKRFVLQHVQDVEPALKTQATGFRDLAMAQFVTGAVTRASYAIPTVLGITSGTGAAKVDTGVASERFLRQQWDFDPILKAPSLLNATFLPGFGELEAFCDLNTQDVAFAYDTSTECKLNADYSVSIKEASALIALFSDTTPWEWTKSSDSMLSTPQSSTRAALLIDAFLAQPFGSSRECQFLVENIAAAYKLSADEKKQACVQETSGIYLQLSILTDSGFASKPRRYTMDLQAYLRYAATKFVYEPRVLGLHAIVLVSGASSPVGPSPVVYPIGGYLAASTVSRVLFGDTATSNSQATAGIWTNESIANGQRSSQYSGLPPQLLTLQIPLANDSALFVKKNHVVGELLAIDNATDVVIWSERVSLSAIHVTDGSQFTTAILVQKLISGGGAQDFPPLKLVFYWSYARRFMQAEFVRNVTRFGIPLMRYSVSSWLNPTTLPSGVSSTSASIPGSSTAMLNMSLLVDSLQLGLSGATSEAGAPPDTSIDVDPLTGVVYHQRLVWQLSALVTRDPANNDVWHKNLRECWLPLVWVQEQGSVSSTTGLSLAQVAKPGPFAREKVATWELAGGVVYVAVGAALAFFYARRQRIVYLHRIRSVRPEQAVCLLEDEPSSLVSPTNKPPTKSSGMKDVKQGLRHRENGTEVEPDLQSLKSLTSSSSNSKGSKVSDERTKKEEKLHMNASPSGGSRSARKKTQPRIQTIVEQTDGVGDNDTQSNGGELAKHSANTSTSEEGSKR